MSPDEAARRLIVGAVRSRGAPETARTQSKYSGFAADAPEPLSSSGPALAAVDAFELVADAHVSEVEVSGKHAAPDGCGLSETAQRPRSLRAVRVRETRAAEAQAAGTAPEPVRPYRFTMTSPAQTPRDAAQLWAHLRERHDHLTRVLPPTLPELAQLTDMIHTLADHAGLFESGSAESTEARSHQHDAAVTAQNHPQPELLHKPPPAVQVAPQTRGAAAIAETLAALSRVADALCIIHACPFDAATAEAPVPDTATMAPARSQRLLSHSKSRASLVEEIRGIGARSGSKDPSAAQTHAQPALSLFASARSRRDTGGANAKEPEGSPSTALPKQTASSVSIGSSSTITSGSGVPGGLHPSKSSRTGRQTFAPRRDSSQTPVFTQLKSSFADRSRDRRKTGPSILPSTRVSGVGSQQPFERVRSVSTAWYNAHHAPVQKNVFVAPAARPETYSAERRESWVDTIEEREHAAAAAAAPSPKAEDETSGAEQCNREGIDSENDECESMGAPTPAPDTSHAKAMPPPEELSSAEPMPTDASSQYSRSSRPQSQPKWRTYSELSAERLFRSQASLRPSSPAQRATDDADKSSCAESMTSQSGTTRGPRPLSRMRELFAGRRQRGNPRHKGTGQPHRQASSTLFRMGFPDPTTAHDGRDCKEPDQTVSQPDTAQTHSTQQAPGLSSTNPNIVPHEIAAQRQDRTEDVSLGAHRAMDREEAGFPLIGPLRKASFKLRQGDAMSTSSRDKRSTSKPTVRKRLSLDMPRIGRSDRLSTTQSVASLRVKKRDPEMSRASLDIGTERDLLLSPEQIPGRALSDGGRAGDGSGTKLIRRSSLRGLIGRHSAYGSLGRRTSEATAISAASSYAMSKKLTQLNAEVREALVMLRNEHSNAPGALGDDTGTKSSLAASTRVSQVGTDVEEICLGRDDSQLDAWLKDTGDVCEIDAASPALADSPTSPQHTEGEAGSPLNPSNNSNADSWKCKPLLRQTRPPSVLAGRDAVVQLGKAVLGEVTDEERALPHNAEKCRQFLSATLSHSPPTDYDLSRPVIAAAVGPAGVGKAAACEMVATSKAGTRTFADGVVWVRVGNYGAKSQQGDPSVLSSEAAAEVLDTAVRLTCAGGTAGNCSRANGITASAAGMPSPQDLHESDPALDGVLGRECRGMLRRAIVTARRRFAGRRVLVVLEGSWTIDKVPDRSRDMPDKTSLPAPVDLVAVFRAVLGSAQSGSCLLICTTLPDLVTAAPVSENRVVYFPKVVDREVGQRIVSDHGMCSAPHEAIAAGCGHPLTLALIGRAMLHLRSDAPCGAHPFASPDSDLASRIPWAAGLAAVLSGEHAGYAFASAMTTTLDLLDRGHMKESLVAKRMYAGGDLAFSWTEMYLSLATLSTVRPAAPLSFLMRLWKIGRKSVARAIVAVYTALGLASYGDGCIHIHDVQMAYCRARCAEDPHQVPVGIWHLRVLTQYALAKEVEAGNDGTQARNWRMRYAWNAIQARRSDSYDEAEYQVPWDVDWWRLCGPEESSAVAARYLRKELPRHMTCAYGGLRAAATLLGDYRYLRIKCDLHGLNALCDDFRKFISACDQARTGKQRLRTANAREGARVVLEALDLIPEEVSGVWSNVGPAVSATEADRGLANQIVGRIPVKVARPTALRSSAMATGTTEALESIDMPAKVRESVLQHAIGPWLRPMSLYMDQAGTACDRLIRIGGTVTSVALSRSGAIVVSGSIDGSVFVHDTASGALLKELRGHEAHVLSVSIAGIDSGATNPNNAAKHAERIVSSSWDGTVRVWDWRTGKCVYVIREHSDQVFCTAVTPDGNCVASGSMDKTVCVFHDLSVGGAIHTLEGHTDWVRSVVISKDGWMIVSGSDDTTVRVWSVDPSDSGSMRAVWVLRGHKSRVSCVSISDDNRYAVSGSHDGTVRLWDLVQGSCVNIFRGPSGSRVLSARLPGDRGSVSAGFDDGVTRVWNIASERLVGKYSSGVTSGTNGIDVSLDGRVVASGSFDGMLRISYTGGRGRVGAERRDAALSTSMFCPVRAEHSLHGQAFAHTRPVSAIAVSSDGAMVASGAWDKTIQLWQVETGQPTKQLLGHANMVSALAFSGDGRYLVSGSHDESLKIWRTMDGKQVHTLAGHRAPVACVAVNMEATVVVSGSDDKVVRLWNSTNGFSSSRPLHKYAVGVLSVAVSLDGATAVSVAGNGECHVWDVATGRSVDTITFTSFGYGPSTAATALATYTRKDSANVLAAARDGSTPTAAMAASVQHGGPGLHLLPTHDTSFVSEAVQRGFGLRVSWADMPCGSSSISSCASSAEEDARDGMHGLDHAPEPRIPGTAGRDTDVEQPAELDCLQRRAGDTFAYLGSAMGKENRVWTPVFSGPSGRKFVAAGLCTGAVAILELYGA